LTDHSKHRQIRRVSLLGILVNLLLFFIKAGIGWLGHSYSVVADGFHSLSDSLTDLAILIGIRFWDAPPDDEHPYGHKRIETLITLMIGVSIVGVALGFFYGTLKNGFNPDLPGLSFYVIIGPVLSIILKEWLYRRTIRIGRETGSSSVIANAWHHRSDALSSIPPVIAVGLVRLDPTLWFLDQVAAVVIAVFMLRVAFHIIKPAFMEICERGVSREERERIRRMMERDPEVREVHQIRTRQIGREIFVDLHMLVDRDMTVEKAHDIAERMHKRVIASFPRIVDVVIHIEPYRF